MAAAMTPQPQATVAALPTRPTGIRCRRLETTDARAVAALLAEGFPAKSLAHWQNVMVRLAMWTAKMALPAYGYVLVDGDSFVGCLLTLYAPDGRRCNFSSWYVREDYRRYGTILVSAALRDRTITYLNISSERATRPIIEAQGFRRYSDGVMLAMPLLSVRSLWRARVSWKEPGPGDHVAPDDLALMQDHAEFGCICFWCSDNGRAYPVIAVRRMIAGRLAAAQIIYSAPDMDWRRVSGAIGRALARHGLFVIVMDSAGPVAGLHGRYLPGRMAKYARGPAPPRLGDLAYTEVALIGT